MENKNVIRFEFAKKGALKYISHLDLQRTIVRILKRSKIPVRYTQGFNPHPKIVFGLPLSVGCESECELLDVYMVMDESSPNVPLYTPEEFKNAILKNLPKDLGFIKAYYPSKPFNHIKSALYDVEIDLTACENASRLFVESLSCPIVVLKKSKAGDKEIDVNPMILDFDVNQDNKRLTLHLNLLSEQNNYLNPELVMTGLKKDERINNLIDYYTITRKEIIFS